MNDPRQTAPKSLFLMRKNTQMPSFERKDLRRFLTSAAASPSEIGATLSPAPCRMPFNRLLDKSR
ncbi:hypothetical protein [Celeribacter baekdonensis]|uniref:hypothetical protein n=1 Tax=Celeribacter baekdonensis TaxID=875171 RepID=UPI001C2F222C|nr:hypothetical protein [Celeribacter baekdonensis]